MSNGIALDDLPAYVVSTFAPMEHIRLNYAPMGRRFRCWHLDVNHVNDYKELATCGLLLARQCPNFDYVALDKQHRELFREAMQKKIDEPGFGQDAPRLEYLSRQQ
ncbi:hypothetical protein GGI19_006141 [Coemansia pectinata]|uniref:Uncharacterized protein n=1 Tax=Coemansia pectinata TaxID=1052879 RepID=A0A9W8GSD6_9FUNG|nr:hypothetical protein GGI19_006141 [Coemansia pectinata]